MANFLDLSTEVRDMILEYCLIVDYELNPKPTYYERLEMQRPLPRRPDVALLKTNKQIYSEAVIILYGKNVWHVCNQSDWSDDPPEIWQRNATLFRHVAVTFDFRDVGPAHLLEMSKHWYRVAAETMPYQNTPWTPAMIHGKRQDRLEMTWAKKMEWVGRMRFLKTIVLDFSNTYCPNGCCRGHMTQRCIRGWSSRAWLAGRTACGAELWKPTAEDPTGQHDPFNEDQNLRATVLGSYHPMVKPTIATLWGLRVQE